jgi:hypothetical protein
MLYCGIATGGLLLLAAALWLPMDLGHADGPEPPSPAKELAIVPGDCVMFLSVRMADVSRDRLARAVLGEQGELFRHIERDSGVPLADVERFTIAPVGNEPIEIIRTRKAVETKKLLEKLERRRFFKDKGGEVKEEVSEKKVGGKTIYYHGRADQWTQALCVLDRKVFARGNLGALEAMLDRKVKQSPELKAMIAEAGKHSLVAGFQGRQVRDLLRRDFRRRFQPDADIKVKDRAAFKDKGKPADKTKPDEADFHVPIEMLPYKPLVMMKTALITLDIAGGYTLTGRATFAGKESADEGEQAARTMLYVFRELVAVGPRTQRELRPLAPLSEAARKAIKAARVERKGNTLEATVRLSVAADTAKKVGEELAAEKKRREEGWMKKDRFMPKDKAKDVPFPKDGFKDKK